MVKFFLVIYAYFSRWLHCLKCMWGGGRGLTCWDSRRGVTLVMCTCGRTFFEDKARK